MDIKWQKWKFHYWKSPVIWDSVVLPRPFDGTCIRYMKCFQSLLVLILSDNSNIEIWNLKRGSVVFSETFKDIVDYIDFCGLYQHEFDYEFDRIDYWSIYMVKKNGLVACKKCNSIKPIMTINNPNFNCISQCFHKSINNLKSLILVSKEINILNCSTLTVLLNISDPVIKDIGCILVNSDVIVVGSHQNLLFYNISHKIKDKFICECKLVKKLNAHKNKILKLKGIGKTYLVSISSESVKIWKRPDFNVTNVFNTWEEAGNNNEKSILCFLYNSRYLTVAYNFGFVIFDCINGCTLAKVSDAHDTKIIGLRYLSNLSMIYTVCEGEISRLWAFQISGHETETRNHSTSPISRSQCINNFFSRSTSKISDDRKFLGKSMETNDKEFQQISCYLELRQAVKSKDHLVNLENIGLLTSDGSSNLMLWRNRDYIFNGLIKMLQMV